MYIKNRVLRTLCSSEDTVGKTTTTSLSLDALNSGIYQLPLNRSLRGKKVRPDVPTVPGSVKG